jgi:hypothetical protein
MSAEEAVDWCKECSASSIWDHNALQGMCRVELLRAHKAEDEASASTSAGRASASTTA